MHGSFSNSNSSNNVLQLSLGIFRVQKQLTAKEKLEQLKTVRQARSHQNLIKTFTQEDLDFDLDDFCPQIKKTKNADLEMKIYSSKLDLESVKERILNLDQILKSHILRFQMVNDDMQGTYQWLKKLYEDEKKLNKKSKY
ncbi:Hypothetical_protein [Hexamita inflata]|uniref:Hypothetical_protein n=1 Tax=Hexamita inflata TaxID=28002 RepID=A0AA86PDJ4_9EUKA|nr:Hypothetical protein HINF_LOCUS24710 [Hexamita inflata]